MSSVFAGSEVKSVMQRTISHEQKSAEPLCAEALQNAEQDEVLNFLRRRPIHTVCMASYIQDHGVVSPLNRGVFYGYRNSERKLEGVALIGHATLLETENDAALRAFAQLNHQCADAHLVRGQREMIARFWRHFAAMGHSPRRACRESLFEQTDVPAVGASLPDLRLATLGDLEAVTEVNAAMILAECGIDPLLKHPAGFRARITRRIEQGRVWVWAAGDQLVFKADVFAETAEMSYLEGVNVHPLKRGHGHGLRCMAQLGRILLRRSKAICLLVNETKKDLTRFYQQAGYEFRDNYDTIYLDTQSN